MGLPERMKDLVQKYGKVALGVHFSVSAVSITGLYVAIKSNVDVEAIFQRIGLSSSSSPVPEKQKQLDIVLDGGDPPLPAAWEEGDEQQPIRRSSRAADLAASSGGAIALAVLCNKALFPVRVPITIALTPPIARFLARRKLLRKQV